MDCGCICFEIVQHRSAACMFPVQEDEHFHTVCRYVERNALQANLAPAAQRWRWSSRHRWKQRTAKEKSLLAAWPLPRLAGWVEHVNGPQTEAELAALRCCVQRGRPFGEEAWCAQIVRRLGLESTLRPQGRPKKHGNGSWHLLCLTQPGQAHHLNQGAAFDPAIRYDDGVTTPLVGNAITDVGAPHYNAHENMEAFWDLYRRATPSQPAGPLFPGRPSCRESNRALYNSIQEAGKTPAEALRATIEAKRQQLQNRLRGGDLVPNIPARLNQVRRP